MADDVEGEELPEDLGRVHRLISIGTIALLLAAPVAALAMSYRLYTEGQISPRVNPVNTIFASRIVVGSLRIAILVVVVFGIVSICAAAVRGQFLLQVGPIRLSESVKGVASDRDQLASELASAGQTISFLQGELQDTAKALEDTGRDLDSALEYISSLGTPE